VHQFVRVGRRAFIGGCSALVGDVIPYGMAVGNRAKLRGFNIVGMRRSGMARSDLAAMRAAYRVIFSGEGTVAENAEVARGQFAESPSVIEIVDFLTSRGKRHFAVPPQGSGDMADDEQD
jgi:UDP-N-acetylglucosamine acyltransferase